MTRLSWALSFKDWRRSKRRATLGTCVLLSGLFAGAVRAQDAAPRGSLLLGGGAAPRKAPVRLDPVLPHGEIRPGPPASAGPSTDSSCSPRRPVCVAGRGVVAIEALKDLVRAYEEHRFGMGLPAPTAAGQEPLVWELGPGALRVEARLLPSRGFDRGEARCVGGAPDLETARRCIAEASIVRRAPAGASWLRAGYGASQALTLGSAPESLAAQAAAQEEPEIGLLTSSRQHLHFRDDAVHGLPVTRSSLLFGHLEERSSAPAGSAGFLALSLAATQTPPGALRFEAEPDLVDVLSSSVGYDPTALARLFDEVARSRVFEAEPPAAADWEIESASLPRSVALSRAMEPTGSVYVRILLAPEHRNATLAFKMSCESPVSYVWSIVRVSGTGRPISFVPVGYLHRGRGAEARVTPQKDVQSLVLAGTNMGGVDLAHPFDPDHEPHEAHGCQLYVTELSSSPDEQTP